TGDRRGGHVVKALRHLGNPQAGEWRLAEPLLSAMPGGGPVRYADAVAFNQQLVLRAVGEDGTELLRFARFGQPPTESTIAVKSIVSAPATVVRNYNLFQQASFIAIAIVFAALLLFRRDSMIRAATPPAGMSLAPAYLRLAAFVIDFTPFSLAASGASGAPWLEGFGALANWGIWPGVSDFPDAKLMLWWGLSAGGYAVYALVMESITGRTVGKVL